MKILSLLVISLSVKEPSWHTVSFGIIDKICNGVGLSLVKLAGSELGVESENLADEKSEPSADTLDFIKCERDSSLAIDVGVEDTMNVLEGVLCVFDDQRHLWIILIKYFNQYFNLI